jgi:hypothetical protein
MSVCRPVHFHILSVTESIFVYLGLDIYYHNTRIGKQANLISPSECNGYNPLKLVYLSHHHKPHAVSGIKVVV